MVLPDEPPALNARTASNQLAALLQAERRSMVDFLLALAAFDRDRLWLLLGYASLFDYLHRDLGLSKSVAYYRKVAAGLIQQYPEVIAPFRDGRLCLTSVVALAKVMTPANRADVLPRFFGCSKQEARSVAAELAPELAPARRTVVTSLATVGPLPTTGSSGPRSETPASSTPSLRVVLPEEPAAALLDPASGGPAVAPTSPSRPSAPSPSTVTDPLTADLRRLHVTVSRMFLDKLQAAREALSHARPGATTEDLLEAGLDLLLARRERSKARPGEAPRRTPTPTSTSTSTSTSTPAPTAAPTADTPRFPRPQTAPAAP